MNELSPRIMVVDDIAANLQLLEELLSRKGYRVSSFPRGKMALLSAQQEAPDLILLDITMPEMDGFEVCSHLKKDEKLKDIPVIFISALDDTDNKVKALSYGGVDYVTKPFQGEEVFARVETHLKLSKAQKELEKYNKQLEQLVHEKVREVTDSQMATLVALSSLAEYRDETTGAHIQRTRDYCRLLATHLAQKSPYAEQIDEAFVRNIYHAAPLHDIGKVGIPDNILLKPGALTHEEYEIMKKHVDLGVLTLKKVFEQYPKNSFVNTGLMLTKHHHEKWNGQGYPEGLKGLDIPLEARIMALSDVYDALRARRPYKKGFLQSDTVEIIREESGEAFDPVLVEAFLELQDEFNEIFEKTR